MLRRGGRFLGHFERVFSLFDGVDIPSTACSANSERANGGGL